LKEIPLEVQTMDLRGSCQLCSVPCSKNHVSVEYWI